MYSVRVLFLFSIAFVCALKITSACNGYSLKVNHVKNCVPNSIIQLKGMDATLDKDCNIIPKGCGITTKAFKTAEAHYTITKAPMPPIEGDADLCHLLTDVDDPDINRVVTMFGIPTKCPVSPRKVCVDGKKFSISKYKNQMGMAIGTTNIKFDITHDNGKSCVEMSFTLTKGRIG